MSQKTQKPVLSGQRIKTRKRDEKERYDPIGFRDALIAGLDKCASDFDAISRFLHAAGNKLDYRRYGEILFDTLIAGGMLVPGGTLSQDGDPPFKTNVCLFDAPDEIELQFMKNWEKVFVNLMRRFKYLEKIFQDEIKKILTFLKYFSPTDREKLSVMLSLWISNGSLPFTAVLTLNNSHLVKDQLAFNFLIAVFKWWREDKGVATLHSAIKKSNIKSQLMSFVPDNKQSQANFRRAFKENGLEEILKLYNDQQQLQVKKELQTLLEDGLREGKPQQHIVDEINEFANKENIQEHEIVCILWSTIMAQPEWNKKEELVTNQAIRHLRSYGTLFAAFTQTARAQLSLLLKVQQYCYANMTFMRAFHKIIVLFYKTDVIYEQVILRWYNQDYNVKGKKVFVDQMKNFVEWLQNAEEESDTDGGGGGSD